MHFYKKNGKQQLNAEGNLILSKNDSLASHTSSSASPRKLLNARYIMLKGRGFKGKVSATITAINWIWSK